MLRMQLVAAALSLAVPVTVLSQSPCEPDADLVVDAACLEPIDSRHALLAAAQRAWMAYRDANCALFGYRTSESAMLEAQAQCSSFMTRERELELELLRHVWEGDEHEDGC